MKTPLSTVSVFLLRATKHFFFNSLATNAGVSLSAQHRGTYRKFFLKSLTPVQSLFDFTNGVSKPSLKCRSSLEEASGKSYLICTSILKNNVPVPAWGIAEDRSSSLGKNTNRAASSQHGLHPQQLGFEKSTYCKLPFARNLWLQTNTRPPREKGSLGDVNREKEMTKARESWGDDAKWILPTRNTTHSSVLSPSKRTNH